MAIWKCVISFFVINLKFNSSKEPTMSRRQEKWTNSYHVPAAFKFDNLFALCFHVCDNTIQLFGQIVLVLLIARVFDLSSQIFTVTNTN